MIRDSWWGFEFSQLHSLLSWAFSQQESLELSMNLWHLNNMKVIITLWYWTMLIVFLFLELLTIEPTNFKKHYSKTYKNHDQGSIEYLTLFSNYVVWWNHMFVIVCMPPFLKGEGLDEKEEVTFLRGGGGGRGLQIQK